MNSESHSPAYYVFKRFKRNKLALAGAALIAITFLIAILGYVIMPDSTPFANQMSLPLAVKKPGFRARFLLIRKNETTHKTGFFSEMIYGAETNYSRIAINNYKIKGANIEIEEYTGFDNDTTKITHTYSLADVVYSLSTDDAKLKVENNAISFIDYDKHRSLRERYA
jgi:hypothetical protein